MKPQKHSCTTICDLLRFRAASQPGRVAFRFLADGQNESESLTFAELDRRAMSLASEVQNHFDTGTRAILLYPSGLEFIISLFACLYSGVIAVPLPMPRFNKSNRRLESAVTNSRPSFIMCKSDFVHYYERNVSSFPYLDNLKVLATDTPVPSHQMAFEETEAKCELAFLQYTSGATSTPKGVMVTHSNLMANLEMIEKGFGFHESTIMVSWLPHFHDMGLIGSILAPLYSGFTCIHLPTSSFLQHPIRWLRAVSDYRATCIGSPNFGYEYCIRRIVPEMLNQLDLSSLEWAYSGAEPVSSGTIQRFASMFEGCGFHRRAFYPCYGLAEATLFVSGGKKLELPVTHTASRSGIGHHNVDDAQPDQGKCHTFVSCGKPQPPGQLLIVDPQSLTPLPPNRVGEIWVAGPHVSPGYWNNVTETNRTFNNILPGSNHPSYLRTGDLGFLRNGDLFITGRIKDLIILNGINHYPQDFEFTAQQTHPSLNASRGAAFTVESRGSSQLVIVQELVRNNGGSDLEGIAIRIREALALEFQIHFHHVLLVQERSLPTTSSGKIQRNACRLLFLRGRLPILCESHTAPLLLDTGDNHKAVEMEGLDA